MHFNTFQLNVFHVIHEHELLFHSYNIAHIYEQGSVLSLDIIRINNTLRFGNDRINLSIDTHKYIEIYSFISLFEY